MRYKWATASKFQFFIVSHAQTRQSLCCSHTRRVDMCDSESFFRGDPTLTFLFVLILVDE